MQQDCQQTWDRVPPHFRYHSSCWEMLDPVACLVNTIIYLEYLLNVFQIQRIQCQENPAGIKDLLDTAMQVIVVVMDLMRQQHREKEIRKHLAWIVSGRGISIRIPSVTILTLGQIFSSFSSTAFLPPASW